MTNSKAAEEADLKERLKGFNEELKPILAKYEVGIGAVAKITPDGRVAADPIIVSQRRPATAPIVAEAPETPLEEA